MASIFSKHPLPLPVIECGWHTKPSTLNSPVQKLGYFSPEVLPYIIQTFWLPTLPFVPLASCLKYNVPFFPFLSMWFRIMTSLQYPRCVCLSGYVLPYTYNTLCPPPCLGEIMPFSSLFLLILFLFFIQKRQLSLTQFWTFSFSRIWKLQ